MYGHTGRLVDHQASLVLEQYMGCQDAILPLHERGTRSCHPYRGYAHVITGTYLISGLDAATIYPHFTTPQYPVYVALRYSLEVTCQKVVDALPCLIRTDTDQADLVV
jgi:hypothetical protein